MGTDAVSFTDVELHAVLKLLVGPCVIWELSFGSWILLQPELVNAYGQAVIQTLQNDEDQRGCIAEDRVLRGNLGFSSSMKRLAEEDERFVLLAMHERFIEHGLCFRQNTTNGNMLVFPSYYRTERPYMEAAPAVMVTYEFTGFLDEIYATLVVALHNSEAFDRHELWKDAADFTTQTGKLLGIHMTRNRSQATLEVFFEQGIPIEEQIIFSRYIHEHLVRHGKNVKRLRNYVCPCGTQVGNQDIAMQRLQEWLNQPARQQATKPPTIICVQCEERVPLWDEMEKIFADPETQRRVREMQEEAKIELDNESRERILVGDVISTVALAGQICREFTVSDHGIDMEIEFKDDSHEATGQKLYLQLKSGDSYLRERKSNEREVFIIKDERHARYWMKQIAPVMLVIRNSKGEIRWMEVQQYLRRESDSGKNQVRQIAFEGERFDVMSVRRWRDKILKNDNPGA